MNYLIILLLECMKNKLEKIQKVQCKIKIYKIYLDFTLIIIKLQITLRKLNVKEILITLLMKPLKINSKRLMEK